MCDQPAGTAVAVAVLRRDAARIGDLRPLIIGAFDGCNGAVLAYGDAKSRRERMLCAPGASSASNHRRAQQFAESCTLHTLSELTVRSICDVPVKKSGQAAGSTEAHTPSQGRHRISMLPSTASTSTVAHGAPTPRRITCHGCLHQMLVHKRKQARHTSATALTLARMQSHSCALIPMAHQQATQAQAPPGHTPITPPHSCAPKATAHQQATHAHTPMGESPVT